MKRLYATALAVLAILAFVLSFATIAAASNWTPKGYARITPTTAKALTATPAAGVALPTSARHAICVVKGYPIRFRDDGTAPTASEGVYVSAGSRVIWSEEQVILRAIQIIDTAEGASEVTCGWYR